jgi:hypothetical protein
MVAQGLDDLLDCGNGRITFSSFLRHHACVHAPVACLSQGESSRTLAFACQDNLLYAK